MVFECRHNIQNQPISTAIPSASSFRNINTIRKHQHSGKILKYVFSYVFQDPFTYTQHRYSQHQFYLYLQERILICCCDQLPCLVPPKFLVLLRSGLIGGFLNIVPPPTQHAQYQPKKFESVVQPWIQAQFNKVYALLRAPLSCAGIFTLQSGPTCH